MMSEHVAFIPERFAATCSVPINRMRLTARARTNSAAYFPDAIQHRNLRGKLTGLWLVCLQLFSQ